MLTNGNDKFFLVPSRNRRANYEVLWFELRAANRRRRRRACKVDILTPGLLDIPHVPRRRIMNINCPDETFPLPVMPILPLLMLKLKGWTDHRDSHREDFREKQYVDVDDIEELLPIVLNWNTELSDLSWVSREFKESAQRRVYEYLDVSEDSEHQWASLGFKVH